MTATEPVFGLMAAALGLAVRNEDFQRAVMNGTEPGAAAVRAIEDDLRQHRVRLLIRNSQATDAAAERLLAIAREAKVPVLGVTETEPAGKTYQQWISGELDALDQALSASAMSAVELQDVTIALGGRAILDGVSLALREGEFVGLLGPNGAGKTTLMRAILGLVRPASGSIRVLGAPAAPGNAAIGYMPQSRAAPELRLRGRDVVGAALAGRRWGLPILSAADWAQVERALERVGAAALADRPLPELSGGERQRLLIAQAILGEPRLLLLDEPLISLDPSHQHAIVELARALQAELGLTVLFSTHELNPLLGAMDRVLCLGHGAAALGPVEEVITGPVLSRLYGAPIEVVRAGGRIFVMSGTHRVDADPHPAAA